MGGGRLEALGAREEPDAGRGARSRALPGAARPRRGSALGVPAPRCALGGCGCPGARESRCVTGADAQGGWRLPGSR